MEDSIADCIDVPSDVILRLGPDKFDTGAQGSAPCRVLLLLSSALERSVQKNERSLEASKRKDRVTIFHGSRPPALSIRQYLERIYRYSPCCWSCFVSAQIYIDRFAQQTGSRLTSLNVHRLLITSVMVASKFMDDVGHKNAHYAKVGGVSTEELNRLEVNFLFSIDFRLHVSPEVFTIYCKQLEKEAYSVDCSSKAACSTGKTKPVHQQNVESVVQGLAAKPFECASAATRTTTASG